MPGPTISVKVLADLSALGQAFSNAASKGQTAAAGLHTAFAGTLSALNATGVLGPFGAALDGIDRAIGTVAEHGKQIGPAMLGIGGAVAGIGAGLAALGSHDQAAHQQLQAAVQATGKDYEDYATKVEAAIKHQEHFGNSAADTQNALAKLTEATGSPQKALDLLSTATDLAAAKHESLVAASGQLGKAYNGNTRILKEFGVSVTNVTKIQNGANSAAKQAEAADKSLASAKQHLADIEQIDAGKKKLTTSEAIALRNAQQKVTDATVVARAAHEKLTTAQQAAKDAAKNQGSAMTDLAAKLHGQAAAAADTFGGKLKEVKTKVEDAAAAFGQKYGPAITGAGTVMAGLGGAMTATKGIMDAFKGATEAQKTAQLSLNLAEDAGAVSAWAALGPILLIIAAVAALVAIGYVIYRNWDTIWSFIKKIIKDVWDWIKANWPLLLGILLGPIALAAALIYKYWDSILRGIQAVWRWIASVWGQVVGFLTTPIAAAIHWIAGAWGAVTGAIGGVVAWIRGTWNGLYGALTGTIANAVSWIRGAWGSITGAVAGVINSIEGLFNGLVGFVSGLPGRVAGVAGSMFSSLVGGARSAVNGVIDVWNGMASHTALNFSVGGQKVGPVTLPKLDVHTGQLIPSIPHLAQGGLVTQTGLILAHAGEAITPMPRGAMGPAVAIDKAYFSTELDVDSFMRRVAWTVQTQRV